MANEDVNMGDLEPTAKMDFKTMTLTPIAGRAAPNDDEPGPSKRVVVSGPSRVTYDALVEQVGFTKQAAVEERNRRRELEAEVKQLREQLQKAPAIPTSESETTSWVELQTNLAQQEQNHERDLSQKNNEIAAIWADYALPTPKPSCQAHFLPLIPCWCPSSLPNKPSGLVILKQSSSSETREIPEEVLTFDDQDEQSVAFVTDIVKRVLAEMRITEVQVHEEKAAKRGPSKRAMDIKVQQSKLTEGEDILYKRAFREVWRTTFQRVTAAEFSDYQPVSVDKVIACHATRGHEFPLEQELLQRLDQQLPRGSLPWTNKYGLPDVSAEYVMARDMALWQPRYNKLTGTCETANEVKIRVEAYLKKRQLSVNGQGPDNKYKRRVKVVKSLIDIKIERGDVDLESWRFLLRILEHLGVGGMSSEDNGTVTDYMNLKGTTPAPTGMPRKMYDEAWLANIKEKRPRYYEEELRISEEAFELLVVATSNLTS
ncbi:hypothetical protein C8R43DRAFT_1140167 [Mycena crocata]|nr:hypothetical protein C8R43DRAFT_1140167 [Mycena crocata]